MPLPLARASMRCTGVAKSTTFSGFCSEAGSCALPTSMTTLEPWLRRSGAAPSPLNFTTRRPEPSVPRLKSMLDTAMVPGSCLAGSTLAAGATVAGVVAGAAAWTALKAAIAPTIRPTDPLRKSSGRRTGRMRVLKTVIVAIPQSLLIFQRDRGRAFQPTTRAVRHQFHQFDMVLKHAGHATVALPHVCAGLDPVGHLVRRHHQRHDPTALAQRTDHVE